jgi:hypothetical protein
VKKILVGTNMIFIASSLFIKFPGNRHHATIFAGFFIFAERNTGK